MNKRFLCLIFIFLAISAYACTLSHFANLERETIKDEKTIRGNFSLILYDSGHVEGIEKIALMDLEGDEYVFEPHAPEFDFSNKPHLTDEEALKEAINFVSRHSSFMSTQISRITDKHGRALGYEVRPLYMPITFGVSDVLDVDYFVKEKKVVVFIRVKPLVEKSFDGDGNDKEDDG
jgi:hypothetical protein